MKTRNSYFKISILLLLVGLMAVACHSSRNRGSSTPAPSVSPPQTNTDLKKIKRNVYQPLSSDSSSTSVSSVPKPAPPDVSDYTATGTASWYSIEEHGLKTASGEVYDFYDLTAAHSSLPLMSRVRVQNLQTGDHIIVRINDRLPSNNPDLIKLSNDAAKRLKLPVKRTFHQVNSHARRVKIQGLR